MTLYQWVIRAIAYAEDRDLAVATFSLVFDFDAPTLADEVALYLRSQLVCA